jgi:hypothetical protein
MKLNLLLTRSLFSLIVLILSLPSALAQETTTETQPSEKEGQILLWKVPRTGRKALIPDISLTGSIAGGWFRDDPVGDQGENPSRTGFNFQGVELAIQSVIDPYVRGDVFILFKEEGVEIEEANVTTLSLPWNLQIRGGKLLARFGRQNTQHLEQLDFVDNSDANRYFFGPEGFHELGAELSVLFPLPWFSELSFEFLQGENEGNFDGSRKEDFAYLGHWKNGFDVTENLAGQVGLSGVVGFNDTSAGHMTQIYGADLYLRWKPNDRRGLKWQTEYFLRRLEDVGNTVVEGGLYSQLIWQFARRWEAGIRGERIGFPDEGFQEWSLSPQITFVATEFFHLRAQYNLVQTEGVNREQHEAFLQIQFNMGPHGAHAF